MVEGEQASIGKLCGLVEIQVVGLGSVHVGRVGVG